MIAFTQAPFTTIAGSPSVKMVEHADNVIDVDTTSRLTSNGARPDNTDLCFTVKAKGTRDAYDTDYEQAQVKIQFGYCTPDFDNVAVDPVQTEYVIGSG